MSWFSGFIAVDTPLDKIEKIMVGYINLSHRYHHNVTNAKCIKEVLDGLGSNFPQAELAHQLRRQSPDSFIVIVDKEFWRTVENIQRLILKLPAKWNTVEYHIQLCPIFPFMDNLESQVFGSVYSGYHSRIIKDFV